MVAEKTMVTTTTSMATARRATKSTMMATEQQAMTMGSGVMGYDKDDDGDE
jgi:hypothetical protein